MLPSIKIGSLNIQGGIDDKLQDVSYLIKGFDIFVVVETWLSQNVKLYVEGFKYYRCDRKKNKFARRASGGVCVFIKNNIWKGIRKFKSTNNDCMWLKLSKTFFNLDYDIYVCCCYLPPSNSKVVVQANVDLHQILQQEIMQYQSKGEVIIIGDLNSRTGLKQEQWMDPGTISNDDNIEFTNIVLPVRFCQDTKCNTFGNKLLEILNISHLRF